MDKPAVVPTPESNDVTRVPRVVALADLLTIACLLLAVAIAIGGGFRLRVGGVRLSATSPAGPLVIAALVAVVRHARVRRPGLITRVRRTVSRVRTSAEWRAVWPAFALTRIALLVIGLLAVETVGFPGKGPPFRISESEVENLPVRWDAGWYLGIATTGYKWTRGPSTTQQNVAFFPAYPLLMRIGGRLFGGSLTAFVIAGVLVSHAAFLLALVYVYRLVRLDVGETDAAQRAVLLLATYPFSLFHGAIYTESLFLLACLGAILSLRTDRSWQSCAWGLLAGLTRPNGFLLALPMALLIVPGLISTRRLSWSRSCAVAAPVAGMLIYAGYMQWLTGNAWQWSAQHAAWGRTFTGLGPFVDVVEFIGEHGVQAYVETVPYDVLNGLAVLVAVALVVPVWRRFGVCYAAFILVNLVPPLARGGVLSAGRLTATLFPLFLFAAATLTWRRAIGVALVGMALQAVFAMLFYTWRPMY